MSSVNIIAEANARAARQDFQGNKWGERHYRAFERDTTGIAAMLRAWAHYADSHRSRYGSPVGDDGFLGPEWGRIGRGILALLNGEIGGMDGGTLDGMIRDIAKANGIDSEDL